MYVVPMRSGCVKPAVLNLPIHGSGFAFDEVVSYGVSEREGVEDVSDPVNTNLDQ